MFGILLSLSVCQPPQLPPLPQAPPLEARVTVLEQEVKFLKQRMDRVKPLDQFDWYQQHGQTGGWPAVAAPVILAAPIAQATVIPPGYHAHRTTDGRTIVHHDSNHGNAAAHAGIAHPWVKTATAGQTVYASGVTQSASYYSQSSSCPGGNCPVQSSHIFAPFGGRFRR